ncbi:MAG: signal peptidase I [Desulfurococcales archaeon]|nr:signal peptidase I [Desulfurococcales archaeon]
MRRLGYISGMVEILLASSILMVMVSFTVLGVDMYLIPTSSMEPIIPRGSIVIVEPVSGNVVSVGDVVAAWDEKKGVVVVHRVVEKDVDRNTVVLKGDAGPVVEEYKLSNVRGRVLFIIPYIGLVVLNPLVAVIAGLLILPIILRVVYGLISR